MDDNIRDIAAQELAVCLYEFSGNNDKISVLDVKAEYRMLISFAYNYELKQYRLATIGIDEIYISPVYYYDIHKSELEDIDIAEVRELIALSIMVKPLKVSYGKYDYKAKLAPNQKIWGIVNLLLCEANSYFGDRPYLNGHTAKIDLDRFNADIEEGMGRLKILTMVEDTKGNIKNVVDCRIHAMENIDEREKFIKEHFEEYMNTVE